MRLALFGSRQRRQRSLFEPLSAAFRLDIISQTHKGGTTSSNKYTCPAISDDLIETRDQLSKGEIYVVQSSQNFDDV